MLGSDYSQRKGSNAEYQDPYTIQRIYSFILRGHRRFVYSVALQKPLLYINL